MDEYVDKIQQQVTYYYKTGTDVQLSGSWSTCDTRRVTLSNCQNPIHATNKVKGSERDNDSTNRVIDKTYTTYRSSNSLWIKKHFLGVNRDTRI